MIRHVARLEAKEKLLAVEECPLAHWIAQTLKPYTQDALTCDPRENVLIGRNARKHDETDTYTLCRLLLLGGLKRVYDPHDDQRADLQSGDAELSGSV